jgi:hypothetical protein
MAYAEGGGRVLLVPNAFFFDEYLRPRPDYLGALGVEVEKMRAPELKAGEARTGIERDVAGEETEAPFLQGLIIDTVRTNVPTSDITPVAGAPLAGLDTLKGIGVRHWLKSVPAEALMLATFDGGEPALLEIPKGKGAIYYLCQPLGLQSYARVFTRLLDRLGCEAPLTVTDEQGAHAERIEYRSLRRADGTILAFVNNLGRRAQDLKLHADRPVKGVRNLSTEEQTSPDLTLPAGECVILGVET